MDLTIDCERLQREKEALIEQLALRDQQLAKSEANCVECNEQRQKLEFELNILRGAATEGSTLLEERDQLKQQLANAKADNYELERRIQKAECILEQIGYRRCAAAACNCNGYHQQREEPEV